jgi:hypothetical protein
VWPSRQTSPPARVSLAYITIGSLLIVWSGVWFVYLYNHPPENTNTYYWVTGLLITGFTLLLIGISLGRIAQASRSAETSAGSPVPLVPGQVVPPLVAPPPGTMPTVAPGQVLPPGTMPPQQLVSAPTAVPVQSAGRGA